MRGLLSKPKFWLGIFAIGILAFIILGPVQSVMNLVAVQNAVRRDWEISYGDPLGFKPAVLPQWLDSLGFNFLQRQFGHTRGYSGKEDAKSRNRDIVYYERFTAFFRGPIEYISVYDFEAFYGDLGAAFERLPELRRVTVWAGDSKIRPTEAEWTLFCKHLRALPNLEEPEIGGLRLTDGAIAELAGHPKLRKLAITDGRLTEASTKTFVSLPQLTTLRLDDQSNGDVSFSPEVQARMSAALPGVQITYP